MSSLIELITFYKSQLIGIFQKFDSPVSTLKYQVVQQFPPGIVDPWQVSDFLQKCCEYLCPTCIHCRIYIKVQIQLCDNFVIKVVLILKNTGNYSSQLLTKGDRNFFFCLCLPTSFSFVLELTVYRGFTFHRLHGVLLSRDCKHCEVWWEFIGLEVRRPSLDLSLQLANRMPRSTSLISIP